MKITKAQLKEMIAKEAKRQLKEQNEDEPRNDAAVNDMTVRYMVKTVNRMRKLVRKLSYVEEENEKEDIIEDLKTAVASISSEIGQIENL